MSKTEVLIAVIGGVIGAVCWYRWEKMGEKLLYQVRTEGCWGITGSTILIQSGEIRVMDKQSTAAAVIKGYEDLVAMGIVGRDDKHRVLIGNNEDGGAVVVQSDDGSGQAAMGISRGGGIVTTRDKNGNHSWASIGN